MKLCIYKVPFLSHLHLITSKTTMIVPLAMLQHTARKTQRAEEKDQLRQIGAEEEVEFLLSTLGINCNFKSKWKCTIFFIKNIDRFSTQCRQSKINVHENE